MAGKVLRCDHDGCPAEFPTAPVDGIHWQIRAEAEKAGWTSSRAGKFNVDNDSDRTIRDFCPKHVADMDAELRLPGIHEVRTLSQPAFPPSDAVVTVTVRRIPEELIPMPGPPAVGGSDWVYSQEWEQWMRDQGRGDEV